MTQILLGFVVAFVVSMATNWPLVYCLIGVGVGWLLLLRGAPGGNLGTTITNAVSGFFGTTQRLVVFTFVFVGLMMLVGSLTGNSPYWITQRFKVLGWDVWNWPADIGLPVLLFVCSIALVAGIAITAAQGRWRIAGLIFGISFIMIFVMMSMTRLGEAIRPKPATPLVAVPGGPPLTKWDDTDQASAERGVIPTAFCVGYKWAFGPRWPCGSSTAGQEVKEAIRSALPARSSASPVTTAAPAVVEFPTRGEGHATKAGLKAYLDPAKTYTRPSGPARYIFVEDPSLFFDDVTGHVVDRTENRKIWREMPAGKYLVEPLDGGDIFFKWWQ